MIGKSCQELGGGMAILDVLRKGFRGRDWEIPRYIETLTQGQVDFRVNISIPMLEIKPQVALRLPQVIRLGFTTRSLDSWNGGKGHPKSCNGYC